MADFGGCAPGFEMKMVEGRPVCVPVKKLFGREGGYVRKKGEICTEGMMVDPTGRMCVPIPKSDCKDGFHLNPNAGPGGACEKTPDCKDGFTFNPAVGPGGACVPERPDCEKPGFVFDPDAGPGGACTRLDQAVPEHEACPIDSDFDPKTGACLPRGKRIPSILERVPRVRYSSVPWRTNPVEPIWHSPDDNVSKGTVGDWRNCRNPKLIRVLNMCREGGAHVFTVTDGRQIEWIGQARYRLKNLYQVAEELYGKKIIDPKTKRPLPEAIGLPLHLTVRCSVEQEDRGPLVIEGRDRVWYVVNPYMPGQKY